MACWPGAGQKRHLRWLRHYLVSVTRGSGPGGGAPGLALHLYDLRKKLVAATLPLQAVRSCARPVTHGLIAFRTGPQRHILGTPIDRPQ